MDQRPPDEFRPTEDMGAPRDAWVAWLMRAPAHEVLPDSPRLGDWTGFAMLAGVVLFWTATAGLLWRAVA